MAERALRLSLAGVAVVVMGGTGWAIVWMNPPTTRAATPAASPAVPTGTAQVTRTTVTEAQQVNGNLTFAGEHTVLAGAPGALTRLPALGATIRRGETVYESDGEKVPLLYGSRPAWRALALGMTDGSDVLQLERNLRALGYGSGLTVDRHFSLATYYAVKRWQRHLGRPRSGQVALGRAVFLPGPLRVTGLDAKAGAPLQPGLAVLHGGDPAPVVNVDLDPAIAPDVRVGDRVTVTLADGKQKRGRVASISPVAVNQQGENGAPGQSLLPLTVRLPGRLGRVLDQTMVQVAVTSQQHKDVLAVPIVALLAQPGGRFAVTTAEGGTVPVETGLFDEAAGLVEVTGVTEGTSVEVPAS